MERLSLRLLMLLPMMRTASSGTLLREWVERVRDGLNLRRTLCQVGLGAVLVDGIGEGGWGRGVAAGAAGGGGSRDDVGGAAG